MRAAANSNAASRSARLAPGAASEAPKSARRNARLSASKF